MASAFPIKKYIVLDDEEIIRHFSDEKYEIPIHGSHHAFSSDFSTLADGYHQEGLLWSRSQMEDYFRKGLLSFYIADLFGVPCIDEFDKFKPYVLGEKLQLTYSVAGKKEFEATYEEADCHLSGIRKIKFMHIIHNVVKEISSNPELLNYGACYLQLRRMQEELDKNSSPDALDIAIQIPIINHALRFQGLAYNIVNSFRAQVIMNIKSRIAKEGELEDIIDSLDLTSLPEELIARADGLPDYEDLSIENYRKEYAPFLDTDDDSSSSPRM